jgi:hypothetical protein
MPSVETTTEKIKIVKVEILWSESPVFQRRYGDLEPKHPVECSSLSEANSLLRQFSCEAPGPRGGYDKTAFRVTWADGETYEGRYDLHHIRCRQENPNGRIDIGDHIRGFLTFYAGLRRPSHMDDATYRRVLGYNKPEHQQQCREVLESYEID